MQVRVLVDESLELLGRRHCRKSPSAYTMAIGRPAPTEVRLPFAYVLGYRQQSPIDGPGVAFAWKRYEYGDHGTEGIREEG